MTSRRWRMRWTTWPPTWQRSQHSLPASVILCRTGVIRSPNWPVFIHCWKRFAWSASFFFYVVVCFLLNPFLAFTPSYDVHGKVFSLPPERCHRVPCLNSDCTCMLRRSQVLEKWTSLVGFTCLWNSLWKELHQQHKVCGKEMVRCLGHPYVWLWYQDWETYADFNVAFCG